MEEEGALENATRLGEAMRNKLRAMMDDHPSIGDVRGLGMFNGIELIRNRETREPLVPFGAKGDAAAPMTAMMKKAMGKGRYLSCCNNIIRLTQPLNITEDDMFHGLSVLGEVLEIADAEVKKSG